MILELVYYIFNYPHRFKLEGKHLGIIWQEDYHSLVRYRVINPEIRSWLEENCKYYKLNYIKEEIYFFQKDNLIMFKLVW